MPELLEALCTVLVPALDLRLMGDTGLMNGRAHVLIRRECLFGCKCQRLRRMFWRTWRVEVGLTGCRFGPGGSYGIITSAFVFAANYDVSLDV